MNVGTYIRKIQCSTKHVEFSDDHVSKVLRSFHKVVEASNTTTLTIACILSLSSLGDADRQRSGRVCGEASLYLWLP